MSLFAPQQVASISIALHKWGYGDHEKRWQQWRSANLHALPDDLRVGIILSLHRYAGFMELRSYSPIANSEESWFEASHSIRLKSLAKTVSMM